MYIFNILQTEVSVILDALLSLAIDLTRALKNGFLYNYNVELIFRQALSATPIFIIVNDRSSFIKLFEIL